MHGLGKLQELIDAGGTNLTSRELLIIIRDGLNLANAAYLALHVPPLTRKQIYGEVTYSNEWVSQYISKDYVRIDPVIAASS